MRQQYTATLALTQQRTMPAWLQSMALALEQVLLQRAVQPMRQQYTAALALVPQRAMRCWLWCGLRRRLPHRTLRRQQHSSNLRPGVRRRKLLGWPRRRLPNKRQRRLRSVRQRRVRHSSSA
jgi:hypothetical protein